MSRTPTPAFFPRQTVVIPQMEEPSALRRFSTSLVGMAVVAGIVLRLYRALALSYVSTANWGIAVAAVTLGVLIAVGLITAHLANFTVRRWLWRVPAYIGIQIATEMLVSVALIALGLERIGSQRAALSDWPALLTNTLQYRIPLLGLWSLVLAGVITVARRAMEEDDEEDEEEAVEA